MKLQAQLTTKPPMIKTKRKIFSVKKEKIKKPKNTLSTKKKKQTLNVQHSSKKLLYFIHYKEKKSALVII